MGGLARYTWSLSHAPSRRSALDLRPEEKAAFYLRHDNHWV
jgi:hypothetical protein